MSSDPQAPIPILIVDDSEVVRTGLRTLLSREPGIRLLGEAATVAEAVTRCVELQPAVALLDIRLPDGTGFDACRRILVEAPETRVLILTSVADDTMIDEAIRAGAHGYLLKEINRQGLLQAIAAVAAGQSIIDPAITARVIRLVRNSSAPGEKAAFDSLSPQERKVLALIAAGRTNKEVAGELNLSEKTVKNYLSNVFDKLHVTRRAQAAALFVKNQPPAG